MSTTLKLSPLTKSILIALSPVLLMAGSVSAARAAACGTSPTTTCGLSPYDRQDLYIDGTSGTGFLNDATSSNNIYMNARGDNDTQTLTVSGTDMSGKYIQASHSGTANITLNNHATADMIEGGNGGATTNINILVDNATLNGEQNSVKYNKKTGDKAYMMGSAIFIDPLDNGVHTISVRNNSQLHGSILTGGAAAQSITLDGSTLDKGGIYAMSETSDNSVVLNNARLDASQSPVSANLAAIAKTLSDVSHTPLPASLTDLDDLAIGLAGTRTNQLTLSGSTVTGDIGLMNTQGTNRVDMKNSSVKGDVVLASQSGASQFTASGSSVSGDVMLDGNNTQKTVALTANSTVDGNLILSDSTSSASRNSTLQAAPAATQVSLAASTVKGDVSIAKSSGQVNVMLDGSTVGGAVDLAAGTGTTSLTVQNGSQIAGDVALSGSGNAQVLISGSQLDGNLDTSANAGNTSVIIGDASTVAGDVKTGTGSDSIVIVGGSQVDGNIDGGAGSNSVVLDSNSSIDGQITHVDAVYATQDNAIVTPNIGSGTAYSLMNRSMLVGQTMSDATVTMSTDSSLMVTGAVTGVNAVTISQMAKQSQPGQVVIASFSDLSQGTVNYQFANGKQRVAARSGAWNYDVTAATVPMNNATSGAEIVLTQQRSGLANDVKGAIAGLDAAKQSGLAVADDLAARMDTLRSSFLLHGVDEGAHLWGDYLYQNGDVSDDVDYHSVLQGAQIGVDWSHQLTNGDSLTGGIALAWTRNRVSDSDAQGNFDNAVYGNFYSLYGGWQQAWQDNRWSLFADGSVSLGDMRYSLSANNVQSATTGMQEALNGSYNGKMIDAETRAGVTFHAGDAALIQPYALLGWNKAQNDSFSDAQIDVAKNKVAAWRTGGGLRVTGDVETGNLHLMPWADARYVSEFSDDTSITAADYRQTAGHNQKMGIFGAGVNVGITKDLHFTSGVYTGAGDVDNSVSVQAGLNFNF